MGGKYLRGVGGFAGGVGKALDPLAVDVADGQKNDSADGKTESGASGPAAAEPVVHEDEPAGADHGAESESEIVVQAKFASEGGHLEDAEQFVEEIGGEERSDFAGVVGRGDFDEVAADDVETAKGANELEDLDAGEAADLRGAGAGSVGGIDTVDIESDVNGFTAKGARDAVERWADLFCEIPQR